MNAGDPRLGVGTKIGTVRKVGDVNNLDNRRKDKEWKGLLEPPAGIEPATC
jgi:hypothetical protein